MMRLVCSYLAIHLNVLLVSLRLLGYLPPEATAGLQVSFLILLVSLWCRDGSGVASIPLKKRLGWLLVSLLFMVTLALLVSFFVTVHSDNQLTLTTVQKQLPLGIFGLFLLNASLAEEYCYRQVLWEKLPTPLLQVGVTSALFTLAHHPTNLVTWLIYGGLGLTIGVLRLKTDNLATMLLHVLWNGIVLILSFV